MPKKAHPILEQDSASEWMGIEVQEVNENHAVISMKIRQDMVNGFGIAHGGMVFALADTAFALACNQVDAPPQTITVASGADINFIASAREGQILTAQAQCVASTGKSGVYDVNVTDEKGRIIAEFRGRSRTISKASPSAHAQGEQR